MKKIYYIYFIEVNVRYNVRQLTLTSATYQRTLIVERYLETKSVEETIAEFIRRYPQREPQE